jgi:peptidoglycan/LPS O-acetylase OafA/YrhL
MRKEEMFMDGNVTMNKACDMGLLSLFRFMASVFVVLFHCRTRSPFLAAAPKIFSAGPQMVTFFFVLSGFSLMLAYSGNRAFSHRTYWTNRVARILPVYLIGIGVALVVNPFDEKPFTLTGLFLHLTFTHALIPTYPLTINGPAWFMSVVVIFYALFPFVLKGIKKLSPRPERLIASAFLLWLLTQAVLAHFMTSGFYKGFPSASHDLIFYFPAVHFSSFLLGIAAAYGIQNDYRWRVHPSLAFALLFLSVFAVASVIENQVAVSRFFRHDIPFGSSFYAPFFLVMIVCCSMVKGAPARFLSLPVFAFLGEISFAVYMLQIPVRCITSYILENRVESYDLRMLVFLTVLIGIGIIINRTVERPFRIFLKKAG